mgnify:CR=1 FL=1
MSMRITWKTSDTKEIIPINSKKLFYFVQPERENNIPADIHKGDGYIGEKEDVFWWIAFMNLPYEKLEKADNLIKENFNYSFRNLGIGLYKESYYESARTGFLYTRNDFLAELFELNKIDDNNKIEGIELEKGLKHNQFIEHRGREFIGGLKYPPKFSFNLNADYYSLEESELIENTILEA